MLQTFQMFHFFLDTSIDNSSLTVVSSVRIMRLTADLSVKIRFSVSLMFGECTQNERFVL